RDGDRLGFPVFAMDWTDPKTGETISGFKEKGFLPEAFINMLAMLGWNDGSGQEIFSLDELIQKFSMDRVHKAGAKFDYVKAKCFNHEWIRKEDIENYSNVIKNIFSEKGIAVADEKMFAKVIESIRDRCTLLPDFYEQGKFFFEAPAHWDL